MCLFSLSRKHSASRAFHTLHTLLTLRRQNSLSLLFLLSNRCCLSQQLTRALVTLDRYGEEPCVFAVSQRLQPFKGWKKASDVSPERKRPVFAATKGSQAHFDLLRNSLIVKMLRPQCKYYLGNIVLTLWS